MLRHAAKSFGAVQALVDGSIELYPGEAHALVGENGAGKSTLVKILAGVYQPDAGSLLADGLQITLNGPAAALAAGIAVIYQEPALFPDLSVAENMFIGRQPLGSGRRIDRRAMRTEAAAIFARLGVALDPARIARGLSIADQQVVEIGKAISLEARVIVMDEPTAALSAAEVDRLFDVVRALRAAGTAVLFISHRLEEVFALCQRVTVMRDGRQVLSRELEGLVAGDLVRAMVGRELAERPPGEQVAPGEPLLTVDRLTREGVFTDISFTVRAGEIVALAGLVGSGRSEVARAIFGIDRYDAGAVTLRGQRLRRGSPTGAMAAGVGFVPEDRRQQGLVMDMSVQQNVALASLGRLRHGGLIRASAERAMAADWASRLKIKYGRLKDPVSMLSGGNQQKVVLAKWLGRKPAVLIVDEPTRGIDVATKAEVHHLLVQLARDGVGVLMISSELPEVLRISDRILVMREGRLMTELAHAQASEEEILAAATGQPTAGVPTPGQDKQGGRGTVSTALVSQSERPPAPAGTGARKLTERAFRIRESGIVVVLVVFVAVTASVQPRFLNITNIQFILVNTTVFALLALGETMVVISRNYDLSVGSVLGLSAYLSASLFGGHPGFPIPLAFLAGLGIGLGCGMLNGIMVAAGRVPSLVVTLATLYIFRGIDILIVGGKEVVANSLPSAFLEIPKATVLGIPAVAIAIAVVIAIGAYYLRSFRSGRELYAMGSNPEAARLAGIGVGRRVFVAFTVSGAIAGVAGVLWAAQYGTIDSTAGTGYELQVISAVVVGGVAIFGGSGSAVGAALGALLLNTISSALYVLGISPFWNQAIFGFLLLLAITLDRFISLRLTAALRVRGARHE